MDLLKKRKQVQIYLSNHLFINCHYLEIILVLLQWFYLSGGDSIVKQIDSEKMEDQTRSISNNVRDQASYIDDVGCEKLLFSVFSLLQNLGADERPEVH